MKNEIEKCPVCEVGILSLNRWREFECLKCEFTCQDHFLPRIASAMDLARSTVLIFELGLNEAQRREASIKQMAAEKSVLEVFNDK